MEFQPQQVYPTHLIKQSAGAASAVSSTDRLHILAIVRGIKFLVVSSPSLKVLRKVVLYNRTLGLSATRFLLIRLLASKEHTRPPYHLDRVDRFCLISGFQNRRDEVPTTPRLRRCYERIEF